MRQNAYHMPAALAAMILAAALPSRAVKTASW